MLYDQQIIKGQKLNKRRRIQPSQGSYIDEKVEKVVKINDTEKNKLIEQGRKEAIKEIAKQEIKQLPRLTEMEKMQDRELMRLNSIFPFDFFTDTLVIEENKLTFIWKFFFWSREVRSILLKDVANVTVDISIFFATLNVVDKFFENQPMSISYLNKNEAMQARRIIQGLIISYREGITFSNVSEEEVIKHTIKLGRADRSS